MSKWFATASGALDVTGLEFAQNKYEIAALPAFVAEPVFLFGEGAACWRALVESPVDDAVVSESERETLHTLARMGLASTDPQQWPSRVRILERPWLVSPVHELVYALLAKVADQLGIDILFIKGPVLFAQGLRRREHSGDVDCWVREDDVETLAQAMTAWGWTPLYSIFAGTRLPHSLTLRAGDWGCAIDVHFRFPGMTIDSGLALDSMLAEAETARFAGVTVRIPAKTSHAVIQALHAVRPFLGRPAGERENEVAQYALEEAGVEALSAAVRLGADYVLQHVMRLAFPGEDLGAVDATEPVDWRWRLTPQRHARFFAALRLVPWRQRFNVVRRLLWPSAESYRTGFQLPDASWLSVTRMRVKRLWRVVLKDRR